MVTMTNVAARFVTTACFVTQVTKRVKSDALPARFVTQPRFVTQARFITTW